MMKSYKKLVLVDFNEYTNKFKSSTGVANVEVDNSTSVLAHIDQKEKMNVDKAVDTTKTASPAALKKAAENDEDNFAKDFFLADTSITKRKQQFKKQKKNLNIAVSTNLNQSKRVRDDDDESNTEEEDAYTFAEKCREGKKIYKWMKIKL